MNEKVRLKFDTIGNFSTLYVGCTIGTIRRDENSDSKLWLEGTTSAGTEFKMSFKFNHQVDIESVYRKLQDMCYTKKIKNLKENDLRAMV